MALFLNESLALRTPKVSMEEALTELVGFMYETEMFNEALFQAEFRNYLSESKGSRNQSFQQKQKNERAAKRDAQNSPSLEDKGASSPEPEDKKDEEDHDYFKGVRSHGDNVVGKENKQRIGKDMSFLERAWEAIKAFGRKLWQKLTLIFSAIKNKLTAWFNMLTKNVKELFKVKKAKLAYVKELILNLENLQMISKRRWSDADDYSDAVDKENERYDNAKEKIDSIDEDATVVISKSELKTLGARGNAVTVKTEGFKAEVDTAVKTGDKVYKALKSASSSTSGKLKEDFELMAKVCKFQNKAYSGMGIKNAQLANLIAGLAMSDTGDTTEKDIVGAATRIDAYSKSDEGKKFTEKMKNK